MRRLNPDGTVKVTESVLDFPKGELTRDEAVHGNLPVDEPVALSSNYLNEESSMDTVSTVPTFTAMTDNDWSSKNLDALITQGHNLNALQLLNRDVLLARGDAALETQRIANELVREILQSKADSKQDKFDLSNQIKEEGQKTRDFIRDCRMNEQAAEIAALKAQVSVFGLK
jgi:polyhydroxyalkanoate synthesis regulator phasin